jgi:hypothetical protein
MIHVTELAISAGLAGCPMPVRNIRNLYILQN